MTLNYCVYQRDAITGHMNVIAELSCKSDLEAAQIGRKYAAREDIIVCHGERIIHLHHGDASRPAAA